MNLKLLILCFFLGMLLLPAQPRRLKKGKNKGKNMNKNKNQYKKNGKILDIFEQFGNNDGESSNEEDNDRDWVYDLQEPEGQCNPNPCLNNGVCEERGIRNFKCSCPEPYRGKKCQKGPKPCRRGTCGQGDCVLTATAPFYECKCREPFQAPNCKTATPVCQKNPCKNGGTCIRDGEDFSCACPEGFTGRFCHVGPNDCYQDDGETYRGNVSETAKGVECLHWNSHFIVKKGVDPFSAYEDADGLGHHNFCRNPDGDTQPWCFIRRRWRLLWDYCDVRKCSGPKPTGGPKPTAGPVKTTTATPFPRPQFSICGKPQPRRVTNRIYGGLKAVPGALPWQVSLQVRRRGTNQPYRHTCGGVLISSCWALTAGHCIDSQREMQVVVGALTLDSNEASQQTIQVERAILHESYGSTREGVYNDIALLRLKATDGACAKESQFVKAACLPDAPLPDGKECTISGWGATEQSDYGSNHLLDAEVLLISQNTCSSRAVYGNVIDDSMFCAGYLQGGVDSCQGDSGGPLTCEQEGTHVIYGLVSWGDGCGKKNKPGVYTRVVHFLDWIKSNTGAF